MTEEETINGTLLHQWFELVWNQKRADLIDEMLSPDCIARGLGPNGTDLHGPEGFKTAHTLFSQAFPDLQITLNEIMVAGDMTATHFTCRATHGGDDMGMPATGRPVVFSGMAMARYRDGKIVEGWNVIDLLAVMQQIHAIPPVTQLP